MQKCEVLVGTNKDIPYIQVSGFIERGITQKTIREIATYYLKNPIIVGEIITPRSRDFTTAGSLTRLAEEIRKDLSIELTKLHQQEY